MMTTLKWQKNVANPSVKLEEVKKELLKDPDVKKEYEELLEEPLNNLEAGIDSPKGSVQLDSLN